MQKQTFPTVVRATGDEPSITITTDAIDRDGDIVVPTGGVFDNYRKNPVVLFGHDYSSIPVGACTGVNVGPQGIVASWKWLEGDPMADRVRNAFGQGVLNAASIGFRPLLWEPLGMDGKRFTSWELLEFSIVPVPANPEATRVLRSLGLSRHRSDEVVLDIDPSPSAPTYELEDIAQAIKAVCPQVVRQERPSAPAMGAEFDITPDQMRYALRVGIRSVLADVVVDTVNAELRRRSGKLD